MSELLRSTNGKAALTAAVGLLLVVAAWFLLVAPQRSKVDDLAAQVSASQAELSKRRLELARPVAAVTVKPGDLYRLTKALPNETDMSGILIDVDRIARGNALTFTSLTPAPQVLGPSYVQQPVSIVVHGRFGDLSRFLGDLGSLVSVRDGRLDARGRLYSVSSVNLSSPDAPSTFPVVKAVVMLNAYAFNNTPPAAATQSPSTSTDTSSNGTVAAGATP